ncbi:MAG TPA: ATPase, T2SS/T4P/T4SS family, partial [Smithella sp.]|nr:ATPase, T2SS/T4P/T4SS family [Smithella sp.]
TKNKIKQDIFTMSGQPSPKFSTAVNGNSKVRKELLDITNRIHAAQNIKQILVDLKSGILTIFNANSLTIYVVDKLRNEIYSMFLAGTQLKEIRLPINNKSIAGYVANTGAVINLENAYNQKELKSIDAELAFDDSWDRKTGFKTRQVLAAPIYYNNQLMGVIQIINKKVGEGKFSEDEIALALEIADVLGVAFYNQQRFVRHRKTRFDYLINRELIKEEDLESAWKESREKKEPIESLLMRKHKISKEDIGHSLEEFYNCRFVKYNDKTPIPGHLIKNLKKNYLRRELWVPIGTVGDKIHVIMDDPNNIIKKDSIESLLKTKQIKYDVALEDDIIKYINLFFSSPEDEHSFTELLGKMEGEEGAPGEDEESTEAVTESDSVIMQLVNKIINDAYNRRASDIHIEPNVDRKNVEIRFRIDGDCSLYQTVPFSYRAAIISRIKIMSNLDITVKRLPQDGKIKFRRPSGDEIELRVATIPTQGGVEDVVMRILAKGETMPLNDMGLLPRNYKELVNIISKPYGMI